MTNHSRAVDCSKIQIRDNLKPGQRPNVTAQSIVIFFEDHLKAALIKQQQKAGQAK
jgi:hypothetical protein